MPDQPAPAITRKTKLVSFDVESNGLHGPAFAVGGMIIDLNGEILDEFKARCPLQGEVDPWVQKYVLPPMKDFVQTHTSAKAMRTAFWEWFKDAKSKADYVLMSNGYPVETRFLAQCQDDDLQARYWDHPFPVLDLSSMLLQVGIKPLAVRYRLVQDKLGNLPILQHNPLFDAHIAALAAIYALEQSNRLA